MPFKLSNKNTTALAVTVYNEDFAVVKEKRNIEGYNEEEYVHYMDVSEKIETDSVIVKGLTIQELNFDYDLVEKKKLLKKYIDRTVYLVDREKDTKQEYRLLSVDDGLVLEDSKTNEIILDPKEELILPKLPDGLIVKPSLIWKVKPSKTDLVDVTYTTGGLKWHSNYVINLKQHTLDLTGWVLLNNQSGTTFENAQLKLIAGDVNRVHDSITSLYEKVPYEASMVVQSEANFEEKSFNDYHLYTLQGKTTLKNHQEKQITLLDKENISFKRYYEYSFGEEQADIILEFANTKENHLGLPLPKGKVKVYSEDASDKSLEFIGEDRIEHTPKEEIVKLSLGQAFDIVCETRSTDKYKEGKNEYFAYEYVIKNRKDEEITMVIDHPIRHIHWQMVDTTHDYKKINANTIEFNIQIPANQQATIQFKYRVNKSINVNL
ncbi:DUF4139 domain-containing protein [Ornithinibacillus caprae]|nr:DUF4139 domain-containing protein [Ornithinibacillus caprae]